MYLKDPALMLRWQCTSMKLWRIRKAGKLKSIKLGGCGPWLTSDAEVRRIEAPPDIKERPANLLAEGGRPVKGFGGKPKQPPR